MDVEERIELVLRPPTEEVITVKELRELFETKEKPIAYNGFEPSGLVHLGTGLICGYKMKDLADAGVHVKIFLATFHGWLNRKLGGDIDRIKKAAKLFEHSFRALGVKAEFVYPEPIYDSIDYWKKVMFFSKHLSLRRVVRTLEIAGRKESEAKDIASFLYTPMQISDIYALGADICVMGMDQRKANVVARELAEKKEVKQGANSLGIDIWKPICVHHHLLSGLQAPPIWPIPKEREKEIFSSVKMSKSKPDTCIFIYDEPEVIEQKVMKGFCPAKVVEHNPILDYAKHIIFREMDSLYIERPAKYGGPLEIQSYDELEKIYQQGKLHPLDLKKAVASALAEILRPVREYFEKNSEAKALLNEVRGWGITR